MGSGFDNDVMYAENVDFSGGSPVAAKVTTNGQLLIGSTASPNIRVGTLTAGSGVSIANGAGAITISAGATVATTYITDSGNATPAANQLNILGQDAGSIDVMSTSGSGNTINIEDRTWTTWLVVDPSATVGLRGTYQTITAALAAASSGDTIFVRDGGYSENLTLKAGVNICAYTGGGYTGNVEIAGLMTANFTGTCTLSGLKISNLNANVINVSGGDVTLFIKDCYLAPTANDGGPHYFLNITDADATVNVYDCSGHNTPGTAFFNVTTGALNCQNLANMTSASAISEKVSGGVAIFFQCHIDKIFACSGGTTIMNGCYISDTSAAVVALALTTGAIVHSYFSTYAATTAQTVITIDGTSRLEAIRLNLDVDANTTDTMITNAGTFTYDSISQRDNAAGPGKGIVPAPTTTGLTNYGMVRFKQGQVVNVTTPGVYPYTTLASDYVILVDTSAARTINLIASPLTGQTYRIKDNVGSAAANNITITPAAGNIDGAANSTINIAYGSVDVVYNGTQWNIV